MSAVAFDTLKFARRLKEAGVSDRHAEAEAEALAEAFESYTEDLATKADIRELATRIDGRFKEFDGRLKAMDARIDGRLTLLTWMLALVVVVTAVPALKSWFG